MLPCRRGDDRTEPLLTGHQRGAGPRLWMPGAKSALPAGPDPCTHALQPLHPGGRRDAISARSPAFQLGPPAHPVGRGERRPPRSARRPWLAGAWPATHQGAGLGAPHGPRDAPRALPRPLPEAVARGPEAAAATRPPPRARPASRGQSPRGPQATVAPPQGGPRRPSRAGAHSRQPSGGQPSRGAHLRERWSPSPSCVRRGRGAHHTLPLLLRSRAMWVLAERPRERRNYRDERSLRQRRGRRQ